MGGVFTLVAVVGSGVWFIRGHMDSVIEKLDSKLEKLDSKLEKLDSKLDDARERLCWMEGHMGRQTHPLASPQATPSACQECGRLQVRS